MSWDVNPEAWDTVVIDGVPLIGIWSVQPVNGVMRHVQSKKAKGKDGVRHKDHGLQDSEVRLRGKIASDEWEAWKSDATRILPPDDGAEQKPHTLSHPLLDLMRINKVWILGIKHDPPEHGFMDIEVHLKKWTPEPKDAKASKKFAETRQGKDKTSQGDAADKRNAEYYTAPNGTDKNGNQADLENPDNVSSQYKNQSVITDG